MWARETEVKRLAETTRDSVETSTANSIPLLRLKVGWEMGATLCSADYAPFCNTQQSEPQTFCNHNPSNCALIHTRTRTRTRTRTLLKLEWERR